MMRNLKRFFSFVVLTGLTTAASEASEVYINQLDNSNFGTPAQLGADVPAYIDQLPSDVRPMTPQPKKKKAVARRATDIPAPSQALLPNVGTGVTLALAPAKRDGLLPNVGRGVVR